MSNEGSYLYRIREFIGALSRAGVGFGGNRDLYEVYGYKRHLTYQDLFSRYERQDIASRVVDAEPRAMWSAMPSLGSEFEETPFEKAWLKLVREHKVANVLKRADILAGIGKFSIVVIGLDDGADLKTPVNSSRSNKVIYMHPYSENAAQIAKYETDVNSPQYGLPQIYRIVPGKDQTRINSGVQSLFNPQAFEVHHSRVLHICENNLENNIFGIPRLERVCNLIDDIFKVAGGSAEMFWMSSNRGMQVDVDKEMDLDPTDAAALSDEVDEYVHNLSRIIRTKGVKINSLGGEQIDPRGTFSVLISLLSGATGIPQRILLGSEAGQLASEQDRANWAVRIQERRVLFGEPQVLDPLVDKLDAMNVFHDVEVPEDPDWSWADAFIQNPLERAQTSAQKARSLANVSKALSDTVPVISEEEGRSILGFRGTGPGAQASTTEMTSPADEGITDGDGEIAQPEPPSQDA